VLISRSMQPRRGLGGTAKAARLLCLSKKSHGWLNHGSISEDRKARMNSAPAIWIGSIDHGLLGSLTGFDRTHKTIRRRLRGGQPGEKPGS
jgi:hypothetical protein